MSKPIASGFRPEWNTLSLFFLVASLVLASPAVAEPSGCTSLEAVNEVPGVDFANQIQPIFNEQCIACHQPEGSGDINLLEGAAWDSLVGQQSTRNPDHLLVEPFAPDASVLLKSVNCDDPGGPFFRMGDLSLEEQALMRDWIAQGAHPAPFEPEIPADVSLREVFAEGTFAGALGLVNAGDGSGRLFVFRQNGVIQVFKPGTEPSMFMTLPGPLSVGGERGLLGLAFHPNFSDNGRFFVNYTAGSGHPSGATSPDTIISEFRTDPNTGLGDPDSEQVLMTITQDFGNHNGGQIKFGPDGFLYIGMGDGGRGGDPCDRSQTLDPGQIVTAGDCKDDPSVALLGKMLRIDIDNTTPAGNNSLCAARTDGSAPYAVPDDNPFVGEAACAEVWTLGLRNPWRWSFDRKTGDLWIADVGQNRWEEVNLQRADHPGGANFGWRECEGPYTYPPQSPPEECGFEHHFPVLHYPISGQDECAVTGGYRYRGSISSLHGAYVYGDFCSGRIWFAGQTGVNRFDELVFAEAGSDLRSFGEDENGEVYVVRRGGIWRLVGDELFTDRFEGGGD